VAKAIIAKTGALSIAEHEAIVSQVKREAAQAHAEMLDVMGMVSKSKLFIFFCFMLSCARYFFLFFSFFLNPNIRGASCSFIYEDSML
jgi:hypothetical protein